MRNFFLLFALCCISCFAQDIHAQKIKTLIVTGQEGAHSWELTSDCIKKTLENSGMFSVDMSITPARGEDMSPYKPNFKKYDLVVLAYGGPSFPEATQKNFEDYVNNGGGVVVVHASTIPFPKWEAFNEMTGLGGWNDRSEKSGPYVYWKNDRFVYDYSAGSGGYHGRQRPFTITHRNPEHPILQGLPEEWEHVKDELYIRMRGPAKNMDILATSVDVDEDIERHEPMLWTVNWGKGKIFVTLMGHVDVNGESVYAMECTGFQVTLLRGAEWAATGKVTQAVPDDFPQKGKISLRPDFKAPKSTTPVSRQMRRQEKIKTLLVTGEDGNHGWESGSDALWQILKNSNLFAVDMAVAPPQSEDIASFNPPFQQYELVVLNYGGNTWSKPVQENFEEFVAQGGGVVLIHSSVLPMPEWQAYNEMAGLGGWLGRDEKSGPFVYWQNDQIVYDTSPADAGFHGPQHPFTVIHRQPEHPILKGLPKAWGHFRDELYAKLRGPAKNMEVLATAFDDPELHGSGRHEPILWTVNWGKGRIFVNLMGHVNKNGRGLYAMESTGFQVTLLRGAEWAATGEVTQEPPKDFPKDGNISFRKEFIAP